MTKDEFVALMLKLADAWGRLDTDAALECFAPHAVYMEPPDIQLYVGHKQLRPYFDALEPGTFLSFENLWFDQESQVGAAEYSFGLQGRELVDRGIIVVELEGNRISHWREYQRKGPANFEAFIATEGKDWQWHIGNYP